MSWPEPVSRDIVVESFRRAEIRGNALPEEIDLPFSFISNSTSIKDKQKEQEDSKEYLETMRRCALKQVTEKLAEEECEASTKNNASTPTKRKVNSTPCADMQLNVGEITVLSRPRTLHDSDSTLLTHTGDLVSASLLLTTALQRQHIQEC